MFLNCAAGAAMAALAEGEHPQRQKLREALREMRGVDKKGFVVAADPVSERFVQFANGESGLVLEIPGAPNGTVEQERAAGFLDQCNFTTTVDDRSGAYRREYGEDALDEMLSDAIRALQGIYGLRPGTPLKIKKGWVS